MKRKHGRHAPWMSINVYSSFLFARPPTWEPGRRREVLARRPCASTLIQVSSAPGMVDSPQKERPLIHIVDTVTVCNNDKQ